MIASYFQPMRYLPVVGSKFRLCRQKIHRCIRNNVLKPEGENYVIYHWGMSGFANNKWYQDRIDEGLLVEIDREGFLRLYKKVDP